MFKDLSKTTIYVRTGKTDLRKQGGSLAVFVQEVMDLNPFEDSLFLFCNRRRNLMKALYWDANGFSLWQKKLEKDTFPWPKDEEEAKKINQRELKLLLEGLDIWKAHKPLGYTSVA